MKVDSQIFPGSIRSVLAVSGASSSPTALGRDGQNVSFDSVLKSFQDQPGLSSLERIEICVQAARRSLSGVTESKAEAVNDVKAIIQTLGVTDQNILKVGAEWLSKMQSET